MNDNITSILSGYELVVDIIDNHETMISELKSCQIEKNQPLFNDVIVDNCEVDNCEVEISSSKIPVATNMDIYQLSNVEIGVSTDIDPAIPDNTITHPISSFPESKTLPTSASIFNDFCFNTETHPVSSSPKPQVSPRVNTNGDFSDISDISHCTSSRNITCSFDSNSSDKSSILDETAQSGYISATSDSYKLDPAPSCDLAYLPYESYDQQVFNLFDTHKLEDSTTFTSCFNNRSTAYYGRYSYCYGNTYHSSRDFAENPYLEKILNYVDIAYPSLKYNSAMVQRYMTGDEFIPQHSDDEEDIQDNSLILTISFGTTRTIEFNEIGQSNWNESLKLHHGDCLLMSQKSQRYFSHGIPQDQTSEKRLSVTLRLIKSRKSLALLKDVQINQPEIQDESDESVNGQPSSVLEDGYQPITANNLHSRQSTHTRNGYQPFQANTPYSRIPTRGKTFAAQNPRQRSTANGDDIDTLYISSSMFRHLDPVRLSSRRQKADVLFYPGADASQMLRRLTHDFKFQSLNKKHVKKVFIMIGTNNVDKIYSGSCSLDQAQRDINDMLYKLWSVFEDAQINVISILPRQNPSKNNIVQEINIYIEKMCKTHGLLFVNTHTNKNYGFVDINNVRNQQLFVGGYDNVHLSKMGYNVIANNLKYLSHL